MKHGDGGRESHVTLPRGRSAAALASVGSPASSRRSRVAVLVPSYNHAPYVAECLRSIFAQTHLPSEVLVIDDGSQDGSPRVIEEVLRECPVPARLIVRENRGLCRTLNEGLALAAPSEFFAYIGSDDAWHPERLRAGVSALESMSDAVLAYSDCYVVDARNEVIGSSERWANYRTGNHLRSLLRGQSIPMSPTVLYRRSPLARFGWHEGGRLEDYQLYLQLASVGPFVYVPRALAYWRRHETNNSRNLAMMLEEAIRAQRVVAPMLGVSAAELRRSHASIRFRDAGYFLDAGDRLTALRLTIGNLHGAPGMRAVARRLIRLVMPRRPRGPGREHAPQLAD